MTRFSSDIISEVVAAADPRRAEAARRKLAASTPSPTVDFATFVQPMKTQDSTVFMATARPDQRRQKQATVDDNPSAVAYRSLGAVLLQKAFEAMIPAPSSDGASRSASSMWNSMLAQRFAESVATTVFRLPNTPSVSGQQDVSGTADGASITASEGLT